MKKVTDKKTIDEILKRLAEVYPEPKCSLDYSTPWQLLFATILSAQCTDERVNIVTKTLFTKYPTLEAFAAADIGELEQDVRQTGFFRNKALHIKETAGILLEQYGGEVPSEMDKLTALPGVGRKTANVVRGHIYGEPGIVVDTHVKRISRLLGMTDTSDPVKAEYELMELLPREEWINWNLRLIMHGRSVCISGRPECGKCVLRDLCEANKS